VHAEWHDEFRVEWPCFSTTPVALRMTVALSGAIAVPPESGRASLFGAGMLPVLGTIRYRRRSAA